MRRLHLPALALALILTACGEDRPDVPVAGSAYVSSGTCANCHPREHAAWRGSHHDLAMQPATEETVLADFDDATFEKDGVESRFFRRDGAFVVRTENALGEPEEYLVTHVFGVDPLQQYLVDRGRGHIHVLPTCWDVLEKRWFHIYEEPIPHGDPLHWTGPYMNWNYMCAECHTTDLKRGYRVETDTYDTTWHEEDVGCQACHGPGAAHVAWAEHVKETTASYAADDPKGLAVDLAAQDSHVQIETCARCHARRNIVSGEFGHGDPLLDHYDPELLVAPLYFPDGQILDEVYVYGSFVQALKYHRGVRCTDCHDPHTARVRRADNALCTECHRPDPPERFPTLRPKLYDSPEHHRHPGHTEGALCVSCHMPATKYMRVDPRRDHGFRVPRPDLSEAIDVPNPCTSCHVGQTNTWAQEKIAAGHPEGVVARGEPHFSTVFAQARKTSGLAGSGLVSIVQDKALPAIVRATAIRELARTPGEARDQANRAVVVTNLLRDDEPLVRLATVDYLGEQAGHAWVAGALLRSLEDEVRVVRGETARALAPFENGIPEEARGAYEAALAEYVERQHALSDRADAWLNLGALHAARNDPKAAERAYRTALRVNPDFIPVRFNLANLLNAEGRNEEAETLLREVIARMPKHGEAHYSLGLLLAELERYGDSAGSLSRAAALMPGRPRIHYNRALVLQRLGRDAQAERALLEAHDLDPENLQVMQALALAYVEREQWRKARTFAKKLFEATNGAPEAQRLLDYIRRGGKR